MILISFPIDKVFQEPIGNATSILEGGKLLQLNPAVKSQKGAIWSKKPISLLSDFTFKSYLYLGNEYANAGDGMIFTLTNDPRMSTTPQEVIGSPGMESVHTPRSGSTLCLEMPYRLSLIPIKILVVPTE